MSAVAGRILYAKTDHKDVRGQRASVSVRSDVVTEERFPGLRGGMNVVSADDKRVGRADSKKA